MRAAWKMLGAFAVFVAMIPSNVLWAQTVREMETDAQVARGVEDAEQLLSLFTITMLAATLISIGIVILGLRPTRRRIPYLEGSDEVRGEEGSYFVHIAFLAAGYAAIILMLVYIPPALTPALGAVTRWVLIVAGVFMLVAHLFAARDEQKLAPGLRYLFTGSVVLAAFFFHLAFRKWSFLHFSDPFYSGYGPYILLSIIILLVIVYSVHLTWRHFKNRG
jgi:hypothetical protein